MVKPYQVLVFDWDGTLMDSEARIVACLELAIQDLGAAALPQAQLKNIIGLGLVEAMACLFPEREADFHRQLADRYRYYFLSDEGVSSQLFEGALETLQQLDRQGYRMAIATGKGRRGLDRVLSQTGIGPLFEVTRCADETRSKPHPEMMEQILDRMGVEPEVCLMIGDTEYDMELAANARVDALAVSYGVHERERLMRHQPVDCLDHIRHLPAWLLGQA